MFFLDHTLTSFAGRKEYRTIFVLVLVFSNETFNQESDGYPIVFGLLSISKVEISPNFKVKDSGKFFLLSFMKPGYIYRENWCFSFQGMLGVWGYHSLGPFGPHESLFLNGSGPYGEWSRIGHPTILSQNSHIIPVRSDENLYLPMYSAFIRWMRYIVVSHGLLTACSIQ